MDLLAADSRVALPKILGCWDSNDAMHTGRAMSTCAKCNDFSLELYELRTKLADAERDLTTAKGLLNELFDVLPETSCYNMKLINRLVDIGVIIE